MPPSRRPAVHPEALRRELAGRGWITSLLEPPGRPSSLFVQNPDPEAADPALAADRITSVLRASDLNPQFFE